MDPRIKKHCPHMVTTFYYHLHTHQNLIYPKNSKHGYDKVDDDFCP